MYYNELLFSTIKEKFDDIVKREKTNPIKLISEKIQIPINDVSNYLTANPSLLFYYFHNSFKPSTTHIETINVADKEILEFDGMFLGHALSPYDESLGLLAELGGFMRISENFNFSNNRTIMLAGVEWGQINWVVKNLNLGEKLEDSLEFREKLYKLIPNLTFEHRELFDVKSEYDAKIKYAKIKALSKDYEKISKLLFGKSNLNRKLEHTKRDELIKTQTLKSIIKGSYNRKLTSDEKKRLIDAKTVNDVVNESKTTVDIFKIKTVKDSFQKHINVITNVIESLGRIDADTFEYFLLQRFHQHKYQNYLKYGVKREMSFDRVFINLDKADGYEHTFGGVYHDDYFYKKDGNKKLTVHPYYFPSGNLYSKYGNPIDAKEHAILIFDSYEKIESLLINLESHQTAIIMSDLLSFAHFVFQEDTSSKNKLIALLKELPKGNEITSSWEKYTKNWDEYNKEIDLFAQSIFASFTSSLTIPYYFYPFLIALEELKDNKTNPTVRKTYSKIIHSILSIIIAKTNAEPWS